jgi:hypothetical protein
MSRRLIISILVVLIVSTLAGTGALVWQRLRISSSANSSNSAVSPVPLVPTADDDQDGLTNAEELQWGTHPRVSDTDNDGFKDGDEVRAGHNPTITGPNDKLPDGFKIGEDLLPQQQPQQSTIPSANNSLTARYFQQVPAGQRTGENIKAFVAAQPLSTTLPPLPSGALISASNDSPEAHLAYFTIASRYKSAFDNLQFQTYIIELYLSNNLSNLQQMSATLRTYQQQLVRTPVPSDAIELHHLLWGYSEAIASDLETMTNFWQSDQIQALVAQRHIEELEGIYSPQIRQALSRFQDTGL